LTGKAIDEARRDRDDQVRRRVQGQLVLDANASEVADLAATGTKQARRGRRPKTNA
jgi:hypothetical protein